MVRRCLSTESNYLNLGRFEKKTRKNFVIQCMYTMTLQQVRLNNHVSYIVNCKDCVYIFDKHT